MPPGQDSDQNRPEDHQAGVVTAAQPAHRRKSLASDPWEVLFRVLTFLMSDAAVPSSPCGMRAQTKSQFRGKVTDMHSWCQKSSYSFTDSFSTLSLHSAPGGGPRW